MAPRQPAPTMEFEDAVKRILPTLGWMAALLAESTGREQYREKLLRDAQWSVSPSGARIQAAVDGMLHEWDAAVVSVIAERAASDDPDAAQVAREIAADCLANGAPLPADLAAYIADFLREPKVVKPKRGTRGTNALRDGVIGSLAAFLVNSGGYSLTRNEATSPEDQPSACDVLCEGLARVGHRMSYRTVEGLARRWIDPDVRRK